MVKFEEETYLDNVRGALALRGQIEAIVDAAAGQCGNLCWLGIGGTWASCLQTTVHMKERSAMEVFALNAAEYNTTGDRRVGERTFVVISSVTGTTEEMCAAVEKLHAAAPEQARAFRLLPYRAVGVAQGMLLAVRCDWMELDGVRYPGQVAALSATEVSDGGGYAALWGGEKRKVAKGYGTLAKAAGTAGTVRTAAARQGDVHRGERHTAAAPEPGRGGGASKASGPGGCPSGADRAEPKAGGIHRPAL